MRKSTQVRVTGPLEPLAVGFRKELDRQGYSPWTAISHLHLMAHVSCWLAGHDLGVGDFSPERVELFLRDRRASGQVRRLTPRGLIPLVGYLRLLGLFVESGPTGPGSAAERLVDEFAAFLADERGLSQTTIVWYRAGAQRFLSVSGWDPDSGDSGLGRLRAADINAFVLAESAQRSTGSLNNLATALRAFLRFLYVQGHTPTSLALAVPRAPAWRRSGSSRALPQEEVARLLGSCDRRTAAGRRDFAIVTVLARLGLRAREAALLTLEDMDWRNGVLTVAGKGNRRDQLPVPADVGAAVAEYCQLARPSGECRTLFLHARAPHSGLSSSAVSYVVVRASTRAGLAPVTAHRLRHSAATAMRRAGAPLLEISQVLRHSHTATTVGYVSEDLEALAAVAQAWPGEQA